MAGRTLKPVERIADIARGIGESDLSRRIDVETDDELGRLAATLNGMIGRLEEAFLKQRRFVADASHELRTPLAVIQAETSLVLEKPRAQDEYRRSLELVAQEVDYMSEIVGKLSSWPKRRRLRAAQFPGGQRRRPPQRALGGRRSLAQEKGLRLSLGPMDGVTVTGDRVRLRQLFLNILDNALRYTPSGGAITGSVTRRDGQAVVSISDTGIGIAEEHLPFIFDRFYRADKVRTDGEGGTGLGLSIATSIAKMHGGRSRSRARPARGTTFRILLPLAGPPAAPAVPNP